ncbi:MAG: winged helix-turn-helix transcriptional regulator [Clostridiales bacterium]|nr:winged helix-turn-helix transcriptional regulator [Clostridiales bacterium]
MSVYQKDIVRIMKYLMLTYETRIVLNKERKLERFSAIELTLLEYVGSHEHVTQHDLLDLLDLKRSKLLSIIKKMIDYGYLVRSENLKDKRSSYIELGPKGTDILSEYDKHEQIFLDFVLKEMTINEEKTIVKFLSKIQQTKYMK